MNNITGTSFFSGACGKFLWERAFNNKTRVDGLMKVIGWGLASLFKKYDKHELVRREISAQLTSYENEQETITTEALDSLSSAIEEYSKNAISARFENNLSERMDNVRKQWKESQGVPATSPRTRFELRDPIQFSVLPSDNASMRQLNAVVE